MTALFDGRDADALERRLAMLALARDVPGLDATWHQLLFDADDRLRDTRRPDQALLRVIAELDSGVGAHLDTLADRLRGQWLEQVLGIPRAVAVADVVPVSFQAEPSVVPVVVPAQTEVRAKDGNGKERRYRTIEPLTVHGTTVTAVRSYRAVRDASGTVRDTAAAWTDPGVPFAPFAVAPADGSTATTPRAVHRCRFVSPVLALSGTGALQRVTLVFGGLDTFLLAGAVWTHSTADGPRPTSSALPEPGGRVRLTISGPCVPDPASGEEYPWVEVALPTTGPLDANALQAVFDDVSITVRVESLPVDAAYAGDAKLDTEREFQPFGPVPRRGDVFQLVSEEAFGKPLTRLGVTLTAAPRPQSIVELDLRGIGPILGNRGTSSSIIDLVTMRPELSWQRRAGDRWQWFRDGGSWPVSLTEAAVTTSATDPFSDATVQGGRPGRAVRAVLSGGDLGWEAYQAGLAQFAADVANGLHNVSASDLTPPDPPALVGVSLKYETAAVRPARVVSTDGWTLRTWTGGAFPVFDVPVDLGGDAPDRATLDLGLALPDTALGSTVSLHLEVESADVGALEGTSAWQVRTPAGWRDVPVDDGTNGLRQSGLLHVVAPADWQWGAPESGDTTRSARWLRLASSEPGRLGALLAVVPDVAEAAQQGRPDLVTPALALAPGEVKGLVGSIAGIKKVANLPGRRGREAEQPRDTGYLRRGSGYHRHRDRAAQAWDYEELARLAVPDLAAVRCLPHTCERGGTRPGSVALVVVPAGSEPMPVPTVALAERIEAALRPRMPVTAQLAVLSPAYHPVSVTADIVLAPGVPALVGKQAVLDRLGAFLHPATARPVRFGRPLFVSEVVAFLESLDVVDRVTTFALSDAAGPAPDPVVPEQAWGLVASSGSHTITVREQP